MEWSSTGIGLASPAVRPTLAAVAASMTAACVRELPADGGDGVSVRPLTRSGLLDRSDVPPALVWPVLWLVAILTYGAATDWYPYPFVDVVEHGYAVAGWIRQRTDGVLELEDAPLYKALHRLERQGSVEAEWGLSENNRRARYYRLTPVGRRTLRTQAVTWRRYAEAVFKVLEPSLSSAT